MMLLRLISWPYFRRHVLRTTLTTAGIVLGVSLFVAMRTANQSVTSGLARAVDQIAGKTELQVAAGETGFNEDVLEKVQSASTVRVAVPVIEAVVESNIEGQGNLLVLGIDMTGDRSLREYELEQDDAVVIDDPLVFLAQPDSLILSKEFADRNGLALGSRLPLGTAEGKRAFVVRGIMKPSGLTSAFGGSLAVMDIYAAQKMFGRGRTFDRIDLAVKPGRGVAECQQELRALLGPAFDIQTPSSRGQQFETMLAGYSLMMSISSAFALFIGMFIIHNAFTIAVTERRSEIGILRALGATAGQTIRLVLYEGALMGLVGSSAGVVIGLLGARAVALWIGSLITTVFGVAQRYDGLVVDPHLMALALGVGVATSLAAAAIPAHEASKIDPVCALQKGRFQTLGAGLSRRRTVAAMALAALSIGCLTFGESRVTFYVGYLATIGAVLCLVPVLSHAVTRTIRPLVRRLWPIEGTLAVDSLIRAPRRTSACVAALMFSLALTVSFEGMARASYDSIVEWVSSTLDPDLFVLPSQSLDVQTTRFPPTMGPEIEAVPGVARVQTLRNARITFRGVPISVLAIEMDNVAQTADLPPVAGNAVDMYRRAAAGDGLIVSDNLAQLQHLSLGDMLEIPAPYGLIRLPIVGIVVDYSDQQGAILMDRRLFVERWHDDSVNAYRVYLGANVSISDVRQQIVARYAGHRQVFVLTNDELKQYIMRIAGQWFGLTSVQIAIAVVVAILGIVNTLTVSITDRRRELGVLQAVGGLRRQIRSTIWIEALAVSLVGCALGFALGAVNLYYVLDIVQRDIAGIRLHYEFPISTVAALVPIMLGAGFLAAIWPAESALRGRLVEALEYE